MTIRTSLSQQCCLSEVCSQNTRSFVQNKVKWRWHWWGIIHTHAFSRRKLSQSDAFQWLISCTHVRRAASQTVDRVKFPGSKASLTLNLPRLVSQRVSKPCWTLTAQNSPSVGPSCQSAHRQTGDVRFTTLHSVSSLLFYFSDESREASRTVLRHRAACSVQRYIHWKGFPSLRPPYPSWSALKNNTPASLCLRNRSFGNCQFSPSETRSDTSYLLQLAQFVFSVAAAKMLSYNRGGCGEWQSALWLDDGVQYGRRVVVSFSLSQPEKVRRMKKEVFMSNSLVTGFVIYQKASDRRLLHYVIMNRNW